jgi:pimeloyl-ACP methyl ester carboxylesterase
MMAIAASFDSSSHPEIEILNANLNLPAEVHDEPSQEGVIHKIACGALDSLACIGWAGVVLIQKIVLIPLQLCLIVVVTCLTAISILFPCRCSSEEDSPTPFHYMAALLDDLSRVFWITLRHGLLCNQESLQLADNEPESPEFILINPDPNVILEPSTPILYAPGYLDDPTTLLDPCRSLANNSGSAVYIVKYRSLFQSIREHAKDVERVAQRIFRDTGQTDLILAGHSMGGIVTGWYILHRQNQDANVKLWVTVASPLQGTSLACMGIGECAAEMLPDSPLITELNEDNALSEIPSLHIFTATDHIVPAASARRIGRRLAKNYQHARWQGHLGVRSSFEVENAILEAIRSAHEIEA